MIVMLDNSFALSRGWEKLSQQTSEASKVLHDRVPVQVVTCKLYDFL